MFDFVSLASKIKTIMVTKLPDLEPYGSTSAFMNVNQRNSWKIVDQLLDTKKYKRKGGIYRLILVTFV